MSHAVPSHMEVASPNFLGDLRKVTIEYFVLGMISRETSFNHHLKEITDVYVYDYFFIDPDFVLFHSKNEHMLVPGFEIIKFKVRASEFY